VDPAAIDHGDVKELIREHPGMTPLGQMYWTMIVM
jgi:hypothetical protein